MTKIISLFNHKGGVSKTTTVFHLGWKMASLGKRVLIVDADPQCNLTGLALGLEDHDSLFKFYDSKQNTDIFNSLADTFSLQSESITSSSARKNVTPTRNENLFILAGNIRFSEIDNQLATALTSSSTIPVLRNFVGAINHLIRKIAQEQNFDIVLVDMSPSVSATNHCILMSSDYFIIPITPDFYCYQAIDSLSNVLPKWSIDINNFRDNYEYALPKNSPRMLGIISENYRVYTTEPKQDDNDQKTMSKAYRDWLDKIKKVVADKLAPSLKKANMIVDEELFAKCVSYDAPYNLASIQNFNSLIPVSQKLSKPIYDLTQKDDKNWVGSIWEYTKNGKEYGVKFNIQEADSVYTKLAESVLKMIA